MSSNFLLFVTFFTLLAVLAPYVVLWGEAAADNNIGVCYGTNGISLPRPTQVVDMLHAHKIKRLRLYSPNPAILNALRNTSIKVAIGVDNQELPILARNNDAAPTDNWVRRNIRPYSSDLKIQYLVVGNNAIPGDNSIYVVRAMRKLYNSLKQANLHKKIKVTTAVSSATLDHYDYPSSARFSNQSNSHMESVVEFLGNNGSPLLANLHPFKVYAADRASIPLDFSLFENEVYNIPDGDYMYYNLFDIMFDAFRAAVDHVGRGKDLSVVVSETGWPTRGGFGAGVREAQTFNSRLVDHVASGTPAQPGKSIETYIYSLFNEERRSSNDDKYWGMFFNNRTPVYNLSFSE